MKIMLVFGTRPEAIKLIPLLRVLRQQSGVLVRVCITSQHKEMLKPLLSLFEVVPDYDLDVMMPNQDLTDITTRILLGLRALFASELPDRVIVQGDTTTAFAAALAAFYHRIPVAHVEAGLRTYQRYAPFPEEVNRRLVTTLADMHFAPTELARDNLMREGIPPQSVLVTGNTVIDSLRWMCDVLARDPEYVERIRTELGLRWDGQSTLILVTGHRRENFGEGFVQMCRAIRCIATMRSDVHIVYPVHLNQQVQTPVYSILGDVPNVELIPPVSYPAFVYLMQQSYLILSDSGGVQEEAPFLKKPLLVMRETTERPEALAVNAIRLVGTEEEQIIVNVFKLLNDPAQYETMTHGGSPYGDGFAAERIAAQVLSVAHKELADVS
ncbi:MAG: UDP-N-acetylglucosamine 2-epimerase [Gammaproteobacteria bacterium RIFCSPHIGHO2_12_FULL_45_9]|nr:MAG: UDP-N-acetylglucosamine 2-epimerase [Gammaproteobacteria bacterium RIFCSPHIGHO2_12_FULL_45_9]